MARLISAYAPLTKEHIVVDMSDRYSVDWNWHRGTLLAGTSGLAECGIQSRSQHRSELRTMDAIVIGAAFVGSVATAFVVQRAVLGVMFRAFGRDRAARR